VSAERLLAIADTLDEVSIPFLVMGGHAVRHYGLERQTLDFDFHASLSAAENIFERLANSSLFRNSLFREEPTWRGKDFRRFQIGVLAGGKEEWMEFWFRNHLLPAFNELYSRRETAFLERRNINYLSLRDLIRSKETEREDDWTDINYLEECLDERNLAQNPQEPDLVRAFSSLRSRRGVRNRASTQPVQNPNRRCCPWKNRESDNDRLVVASGL
jgi:hypothetical protein